VVLIWYVDLKPFALMGLYFLLDRRNIVRIFISFSWIRLILS
jgi:hypothetical protein